MQWEYWNKILINEYFTVYSQGVLLRQIRIDVKD